MYLLSSILFACSANLDNFMIGVSYGMKQITIPFFYNVVIGIITALGTFLSILFGSQIAVWIPFGIAEQLGSILLILLGGYYFFSFFRSSKISSKPKETIHSASFQESATPLSFSEMLVLAFSLTLNNIGIGIGASISGVDPFSASFFTLVSGILLLYLGNRAGNGLASPRIGRYAEPLSGILLIILGLYQGF